MIQFFSTADNVTAIAVASYVLFQAGMGAYRRTLGSARTMRRAIRSLSPGNPTEMVDALFGRPIYSQEYERKQSGLTDDQAARVERRLYNAGHGWLTAHFHEGKLIAFAFMITNKRFRFNISPTCRNMLRGRLGRVTYLNITAQPPFAVSSFMALYNFGYFERHYFVRFGNYHYYVLSSTMHGWSSRSQLVPDIEAGTETSVSDLPAHELAALQFYRATAAPDTVSVMHSDYDWSDAESGSFDREDLNDVEGTGPRGWVSRSVRERRGQRRERIQRIWNRA